MGGPALGLVRGWGWQGLSVGDVAPGQQQRGSHLLVRFQLDRVGTTWGVLGEGGWAEPGALQPPLQGRVPLRGRELAGPPPGALGGDSRRQMLLVSCAA